jgi:hypothetical protein
MQAAAPVIFRWEKDGVAELRADVQGADMGGWCGESVHGAILR